MRGSVKKYALAKEQRSPIDVAATNYGYSGSTIACVLKDMRDDKVGTQLIYMKEAARDTTPNPSSARRLADEMQLYGLSLQSWNNMVATADSWPRDVWPIKEI